MISIIVPVYNTGSYLKECIESIIFQKYDYELILVNDGSTDESGEICDSYAIKDKRIKVIHKENQGVSAARNSGLFLAKKPYIWFLDSDDYISKNSIGTILKYLENNKEVDLITMAHYNVFENDTRKIQNIPIKETQKVMKKNEYYNILIKHEGAYWAPWKNIYKKRIIDIHKIKFNQELSGAEDCDFFMAYTEKANVFSILNEPLVNYRIEREGSITNSISTKNLIDRMFIYKKYYLKYNNTADLKSLNFSIFFANKYANAVSEFYKLKSPNDIKLMDKLAQQNKTILLNTKGLKYKIANIIWSFVGYTKGSRIINKMKNFG